MSVGWRNGCGWKQKKQTMGQGGGRERGKRVKEREGRWHCKWLTDLEGFAYDRRWERTADGKKCNPGPHAANTEYVSLSLMPE